MAIWSTFWFAIASAASHSVAQIVTADESQEVAKPAESSKPEDGAYIYLPRDSADRPIELRVAIVRFVPKSGRPEGLYVDLVSAIHVADASYYAGLNRRFRDYDAVLYELVAPEGTRVPKGGVPRDSPVSWLQGSMTKILGLTFQLDEIDYTAKNFVHADMSPEEFAKSMKDRGETMVSILTKIFVEGFAQQAKDPSSGNEMKLLAALISPNREQELKVFMAEQFADMDNLMGVFGGEDGSTLVTERNKKALSVLQREIDRGKRRFAIFYGAGHMKEMEEQLKEQFGMRRSNSTWVVAWDLKE